MKPLYLDANAHLPIHHKAIKAYVDFNNSIGGHGHAMAPSVTGRAAATALETARAKIAELVGAANANQIIFTSTCSQACEWGMNIFAKLTGHTKIFNKEKPIIHCSPVEHSAMKNAYRETFDPEYRKEIPVDNCGRINFTVNSDDAVICIDIQNETGVIQPISNIKAKYLFVDMSQRPGKLKLSIPDHVDIAVFGAHKFGGPGSVGFMYLKDVQHWTEFGTGSRYFTDRTGTPDVGSVVATAAALQEAVDTLDERTERMEAFKYTLERGLEDLGIEIIAKNAERVPNTTFIRVPGGKSMQILLELGNSNIHVGLGSACGSMHTGPSPLMKAMGVGGGAHDFMRISHYGEYASEDALLFLTKFEKCIV